MHHCSSNTLQDSGQHCSSKIYHAVLVLVVVFCCVEVAPLSPPLQQPRPAGQQTAAQQNKKMHGDGDGGALLR
jgi:hypothetical protein